MNVIKRQTVTFPFDHEAFNVTCHDVDYSETSKFIDLEMASMKVQYATNVNAVERFMSLDTVSIIDNFVTFERDHYYRITNGDKSLRIQKIFKDSSQRCVTVVGFEKEFEFALGNFMHAQPEHETWKSMYFFELNSDTIIEDITNDEEQVAEFSANVRKAYDTQNSSQFLKKCSPHEGAITTND